MSLNKFNVAPRLRSVALVSALALGAVGCYNYSGEGNEFTVYGEVTDPGEESLKVRVTGIEEANGEADGWFKIGAEHQLHDNCNCHGAFKANEQTGFVYDGNEAVIEPSSVMAGKCVVVTGAIRNHKVGKYTHERPVYETVYVSPC